MKSLIVLTVVFALLAAALSLVAYLRGPRLCLEGWRQAGILVIRMMPLLILSFAISGLIQVLVPKEIVAHWLGHESGWRGIWIGCLAGAVTPGGPVTSFPLFAGLFQAGAGIGTLVAYITAWSLWAFTRLPMEIAFINTRFALIRLGCTFFMPPIAGFIAHVFFARYFRS